MTASSAVAVKPESKWTQSKKDANILAVSSYYPVKDESDEARRQLTIRIREELDEDIASIVEIWDALDVALGKQRSKKWKANSVIERLLQVAVDGFWQQVGGRPASREARDAFIARAVEHLTGSKPKK